MPTVWWTNTAFTASMYSGGSSTCDSSAPQWARSTIGGRVTVDGGAGGTVGVGEAVSDGELVTVSVGVGVAVSVGVADSVAVGSVVGVAVGVSEEAATGAAAKEPAARSPEARSFRAAARASRAVTPGSTRSRRSPLGRPEVLPSAAVTLASTASDGPTHRGSDTPRMSASTLSGRCWSRSSFRQPVQSPVSVLCVRTSAVPVRRFLAPCQVMPSMLNCSVSVRGRSRLVSPVPFRASVYTFAGRASAPRPPGWSATATVTAPAPPRTTAPSVSQVRRFRLSGL